MSMGRSRKAILGGAQVWVGQAMFDQVSQVKHTTHKGQTWEVLKGVGVDGVGGPFSFFCFTSFLFSSFFFVLFLLLVYRNRKLQFAEKMGNFTPTPSAPTPFETS